MSMANQNPIDRQPKAIDRRRIPTIKQKRPEVILNQHPDSAPRVPMPLRRNPNSHRIPPHLTF